MTGALPKKRRSDAGTVKPMSDTMRDAIPEILQRLGQGESLSAICKADGMPDRDTVRRWVDRDHALAEQVYQAREDGFMERAERAVAAAKSAIDPQLGRLAFDAERWFLGKLSIAFAERPPKIDSQTNVQVNIDAGSPFDRIAQLMDRTAHTIAGSASSTKLVAGDGEAGSGSAGG